MVAGGDAEITADDMAGVIFQDCVFERVRMVGSSFWQAMFVNSRFDDCEFTDCRLFRTQWIDCSGSTLRLVGGEFAEVVFSECRFEDLVVETSGDQVVFGSSEINHVAFRGDGSSQRGLTISDCVFRSVAAEHADWQSATGVAVDFGVWSLDGAVFDKCMFVEAKAPGHDFSNVRFASCNLYKSDFKKARIKHAPGSIFAEADCTEADFAEADLTGALFAKTLARGARFIRARLGNAMFPDANLEGADFDGADARGERLERRQSNRREFPGCGCVPVDISRWRVQWSTGCRCVLRRSRIARCGSLAIGRRPAGCPS